MALISSIVAINGCQTSQSTVTKITGETIQIEELETFIRQRTKELKVTGLSLAIINDGKISYLGSFGVKNSSTDKKITQQTVFEAASLSKPLFAYFVMLQVEKGLINLDEPLYQYHPNKDLLVDERHQLITARMLLTHTSGLPNWREKAGAGLELSFTPGTQFQYSGEGYEYLRRVIQAKLGVDDDGLQDVIDREIVNTINAGFMKYTWDQEILERKAYGHRNGEPTDNHKHDHNFGASYSLNTTAEDYAKFLASLMQPAQSKVEMVDEYLAIQYEMPQEKGESHRSIGFPVKKTEHGLRYYHSGNNGDFRAYCHFYRNSGYGVVLFSNSDNLFSSNLAQEIIEFLGDRWFYI